jgi:hypothetical protein
VSFTYTPLTPTQLTQVRMLISDTTNAPSPPYPLFQDEEIQMAMQLESSQGLYISGMANPTGANIQIPYVPQIISVYRAAALLLDSLAANKSLLAAVNKILDVQLSAEKAAQELRATAKEYRDVEANGGSFAIVEMVNDQFQSRERLYKQILRLWGQ